MKRFYIFGSRPASALALIIAAALWLAFSDFAIIDEKIDSGAINFVQPIESDHYVVQGFRAPEDNLSRIDIFFDKGIFEAEGELYLEVAEPVESAENRFVPDKVIRQKRIDITKVDYFDNSCSFEFEPIAGSRGKEYVLRLGFSSLKDTPAPIVGESADSGRNLYYDGKPVTASLGMSLFHETNAVGLLDKLRPYRPALVSSPIFLIFIFLLGAGAFGWLLREVASGPIEASLKDRRGSKTRGDVA